MVFNKYIAIFVVALLLVAGVGWFFLGSFNTAKAPMDIKATIYVENLDNGAMMSSNISLNQPSTLEMLTSVGSGGVRSSDFQTLQASAGDSAGSQNVQILSKTAHYHVWIVLSVTPSETGGTNYFDGISGGYVAISAVGNQNMQPGAGTFMTGDWIGGPVKKVVWASADAVQQYFTGLGYNTYWPITQVGQTYTLNQYHPGNVMQTNGDFVNYYDKNLNKNLPIFGEMIDKSVWTVGVECDFHVKGQTVNIPCKVDASFQINVLDWYENHVSVSVQNVNVGYNTA